MNWNLPFMKKHLMILLKHVRYTKLYSNKGPRACCIPNLNVFNFIQNKFVPIELVEVLSLAETPLWSAINYTMAFMRTRPLTSSSLHGLIRLFVKGCSGLVRLAGNQALFYLPAALRTALGFVSLEYHVRLKHEITRNTLTWMKRIPIVKFLSTMFTYKHNY